MTARCKVDKKRLAPLQECIEDGGPAPPGADPDWPSNYISRNTVAYSCGKLARKGDAVTHDHDPDELALCKRLAGAAAKVMRGVYLCMGDEGDHEFSPFFVTANVGDKVPQRLTEKVLRATFGGTLWPKAVMVIEPLQQKGRWWEEASMQPLNNIEDARAAGDQERVAKYERVLDTWQAMIAWFHDQPELHGASFAIIDDPDFETIGAIFPRLALAITERGSLVGLFGCVVHT